MVLYLEFACRWLDDSPKRNDASVAVRVAFSTIRQLLSAASQFMAWDLLVSQPSSVMLTKEKRLICQPCRPTDGFGYTLMTQGLRSRIGDESTPSMALLDQHIRYLDQDLNRRYKSARSPIERRDLAQAGLANLVLWLGWLRSAETFNARWIDTKVLEPNDGPREGLPVGCGYVSLRLKAETKTNRTSRPDVLMAYRTLSGLHIGKWTHRAKHFTGGQGFIFCHQDGSKWTSLYFRQQYLYPSLEEQRSKGDPYLRPFSGGKGNSIKDKFWSLHCYRRGSRSHVSRGGRFGKLRFRKATKDQVYEHARWTIRRSGEAIDVMYREWTIPDRIKITLYSH